MEQDQKNGQKSVEVRVLTTAGSYPHHGLETEPETQEIEVILKRAARVLRLVDTSSWIARCNGADVVANHSYARNGLHGHVVLDYGPPDRGGGSHHA